MFLDKTLTLAQLHSLNINTYDLLGLPFQGFSLSSMNECKQFNDKLLVDWSEYERCVIGELK